MTLTEKDMMTDPRTDAEVCRDTLDLITLLREQLLRDTRNSGPDETRPACHARGTALLIEAAVRTLEYRLNQQHRQWADDNSFMRQMWDEIRWVRETQEEMEYRHYWEKAWQGDQL